MSRVIVLILLFANLANSQYSISGHVVNDEGEFLESAAVFLEGTSYGVLSDSSGYYQLTDIPEGEYLIKSTFLGYRPESELIEVISNMEMSFQLGGSIFGLEEIQINGTWVQKNMPFSYKNIDKAEVDRLNLGQDIPYLLKYTPSMVVTSDAGAGVGYTGMRIRGSDPSRINVTVNGVPLNDSESQLVFWVNMPDFASSAEDIQIQRGVGPSTNGTSAFGATVNINTNKIKLKPHVKIATSYGSFNTRRLGVSVGTGLLNNKFGFDFRYSKINSDGYIDRASSNLGSAAGTFNYVTETSSLNVNIFTGSEITYQAWNGLPFQFLEENRTYNPSGTEKPGEPYKNEVDDYNQNHIQVHYNKAINDNWNTNLKGHYTRGLGFFENYKSYVFLPDFNIADDNIFDRDDIVIRRWLDNHFYGGIAEINFKDLEERHNVIFGLAANQYRGKHFGQVRWHSNQAEPVEAIDTLFNPTLTEYYDNIGIKSEVNTYGKWSFKFRDRFLTYLDLQYRFINYAFQGFDAEGNLVDQEDNLGFFNPKFGLSYLLNNDSKMYISYGVANREPNRNDYTESSTDSRPQHETLYDLEMGYTLQTETFNAGVNIYNMVYDNQLVLTGAINDVGEYTRKNVKDSYRRGIEFDGGLKNWQGFHFLLNATFSENRIRKFTEFVDDWDNGGQIEQNYELTNLAFSPSTIFANDLGYAFLQNRQDMSASIGILTKYVGKQYIDNTSNENAAIDPYMYNDLLLSYSYTGLPYVKEIKVNFNIHNILGNEYVSNAWVYRFSSSNYDPTGDDPYSRSEGAGIYNLTGLYPQAGRYFLLGLTVTF